MEENKSKKIKVNLSKKIKNTGHYIESDLVNLLCTDAVIKNYNKKGWFTSGKDKSNFLLKLDMNCKYTYDKGTKKYFITEIFEEPIPKEFLKLNIGMYQFTAPLLLNRIILDKDLNNKVNIIMNAFEWSKQIQMVNNNYNLVKYNIIPVSEYLEIPSDVAKDFIETVHNSMNYYIKETLERLEQLMLIDLKTTRIICKNTLDEKIEVDGIFVKVEYTEEKREATDEENNLINQIIEEAMKDSKIISDDTDFITNEQRSECYYGEKSNKYQNKLNELLKRHGIKYFYNAYKVFLINEHRGEMFLNRFGIKNYDKHIEDFNNYFINSLVTNVDKYYNRKIKKTIEEFDSVKNSTMDIELIIKKLIDLNGIFSNGYSNLSDVTINKNAKNLYKELNDSGIIGSGTKNDISKKEDLEYNIVFVKK